MNTTVEAVPVPVVPATESRGRLADYVTLTKPGITVMVAITAAVGFYVASHGSFDWKIFLHMIGGTLLSSAGAAAFNMLMERTKARPLAAGRMAPAEATVFGALLCAGGLAWLALGTNLLTSALSAATILSYLALSTPRSRRRARSARWWGRSPERCRPSWAGPRPAAPSRRAPGSSS